MEHSWWRDDSSESPEAKALSARARVVVAEAKDACRAALAPRRDACHEAGTECECEYGGGRSANVSERASFLAEKTGTGVRVIVKGRPRPRR